MTVSLVEKIADAVLYEGYILYPYRPSAVKNQQRWNFGALCPQSYSEAQRRHRSLDDADRVPGPALARRPRWMLRCDFCIW